MAASILPRWTTVTSNGSENCLTSVIIFRYHVFDVEGVLLLLDSAAQRQFIGSELILAVFNGAICSSRWSHQWPGRSCTSSSTP